MSFRGGMGELLRQASRLQRKIEETKEQIRQKTVEASVADGKVKVVANGARELVRVTIDKSAIDPNDLSLLEDLIAAAANAALKKAADLEKEELDKATGGVKIPGLT